MAVGGARALSGGAQLVAPATGGSRSCAPANKKIRGVLLHMGMNMWGEWLAPGEPKVEGRRYTRDEIYFSEDIWNRTVDHAKKRHYNMVVMDLGEFVAYPSHPELAVKGSWSPDRMRAEVRRLRNMGLEPIPKLNLSATHDQWLKQYHRMVSTDLYYRVCFDVIKDVCEIFETPRFMHIGFDEEQLEYQWESVHVNCRQHEARALQVRRRRGTARHEAVDVQRLRLETSGLRGEVPQVGPAVHELLQRGRAGIRD